MSHDDARTALVVVASEAEPGLAAWRRRFHRRSELLARLGPQLPIRCRADGLTLLEERLDGAWVTRATFPFEEAEAA